MRFKEFPASGNIEILRKQNEAFPLGPVTECLMLNAGHSKLPYLSDNVVQRMSLWEIKHMRIACCKRRRRRQGRVQGSKAEKHYWRMRQSCFKHVR